MQWISMGRIVTQLIWQDNNFVLTLLDHVSCLHMPVHWLNNFCLKLLILHLIWVNCSEVNSYSACFYILDITFQSPITQQPNSPMDGTLYIRTCWIMLSACTCWSTVLTISYLNDLWRSEQLQWMVLVSNLISHSQYNLWSFKVFRFAIAVGDKNNE